MDRLLIQLLFHHRQFFNLPLDQIHCLLQRPGIKSQVRPGCGEQLWQRLGHEGSVHDQAWPTAEAALLVVDEVEMVVQVNGKVRGRMTIAAGADEAAAVAAATEAVADQLDGATVRKAIHVPDRLVNLVV